MLSGFLDWYRSVVEHKVEGLALHDATRVMTPTGLSPLGVVAHLAATEVGWFDETDNVGLWGCFGNHDSTVSQRRTGSVEGSECLRQTPSRTCRMWVTDPVIDLGR